MDEELHRKGVLVAAQFLAGEGFEILQVNDDPRTSPQILAKRNGQPTMIMVAVENLPKIGALDPEIAHGFAGYAMQNRALSYFLGIGLEDLGEQTRVKCNDLQLVSINIPLPSDEHYAEQFPKRVRLDRAPENMSATDRNVIWRSDGSAVIAGGDWRLNQWEGILKGINKTKNTALIRFTDSRINPEIREFWRKSGFDDPLFEVPVNEVWLDENENSKAAPPVNSNEIKSSNQPALPRAETKKDESKPWWKVW